jgi:NAD(P)-dependent dehydrogenase (short-subunit alcohol dehydrogenase family)
MRFAGKLALVTGGASGIGAGVIEALRKEGAEAVAADIKDVAGVRKVDVRDRASVKSLIDGLPRAPDLLVTCAGGARRHAALDVSEDILNEALQLNLGGFWRCTQESARRAVAENKALSVVHVASSLHRGPAPELSHFAAAKAASVTMMRCMAQELAPKQIRINAVVPGPVETPATTPVWNAVAGRREALRQTLPLGRIAEASDIVPAILWLLSSEAAWVTGTLLTVDGGLDVAP